MKISLAPGVYVIGVSGGVDSMVLLHMLQELPNIELVVAHFDHQIRPDSDQDSLLVAKMAKAYGLPFVTQTGNLGAGASEATARAARYAFLQTVRHKHSAQSIITAHHQDDVLETAIINWSRGTGWRGLTSLTSSPEVVRPLLAFSKPEIIAYAEHHQLQWREDSTNSDPKYLRNYIRHQILPNLSVAGRNSLLDRLDELQQTKAKLNDALNEAVTIMSNATELDRLALIKLPIPLVRELLITWWRQHNFYSYKLKTVERSIKTICQGKTGDIVPLKGNLQLVLKRHSLALQICER